MQNCLECKSETKNPKFCDRSCSAKFTNRTPKRKPVERICTICKEPYFRSASSKGKRTRCDKCQTAQKEPQWQDFTIGEMRGDGNSNSKSRIPYVRELARKTYLRSGLPLSCVICGYRVHVEICHRWDISRFKPEAPLSQVNHIDNLVPMCKNHHWEYDNGWITSKDLPALLGKMRLGMHNYDSGPMPESYVDFILSFVPKSKRGTSK